MTQAPSPYPRDNEPLRDGTSLMAYLYVLRKAHVTLVGHDKAHQRFQQVATRGHARKYIEELMPLLLAERDRHRRARRSGELHHA
ncbi:hypothetical protein [Pandoraea bronchicola]|uniref:Uncharacterized protein n=1 Tax=Pandoraea bronchicola TaxID=2508287 RepID=A0A5E5BS10_9BURK|nr:hypothetical protein [Pandoraea bronchicola]VVE87243.1 hypothetical protein PBR20603_01171 [Pandoraea bronchicola]